jgi:hypothetical protein
MMRPQESSTAAGAAPRRSSVTFAALPHAKERKARLVHVSEDACYLFGVRPQRLQEITVDFEVRGPCEAQILEGAAYEVDVVTV